MLRIIITSHGKFCEELKKTVEMFSGKIENCFTLPLVEGQSIESFELEMDEIVKKFDENDNLIILTDLRGGTPYNMGIKTLFGRNNTWVISGMNVPMVLNIAMSYDSEDIDELITNSIEHSIEGIEVKSKSSKE